MLASALLLLVLLPAAILAAPRPNWRDEINAEALLRRSGSTLKPLTLTRRTLENPGRKARHLRNVDAIPNFEKRAATISTPAASQFSSAVSSATSRSASPVSSAPPPSTSAVDVGGIQHFNGPPQPERGGLGDTFLQNSNIQLDTQNPDNVAAPPSDSGTVPNLKWSMSLSHTRLLSGGWVREQAITDLPPSVDFAAAEIRMSPNAYRELHWHRVAEWGYVLNGTGRLSAVSGDGKTFIQDIKGPRDGKDPDIYYLPRGVGHSIQALDDGLELLLLFTDGNFDKAGTTFMLSDWLVHTPKEIVAQNLGVNLSSLAGIPKTDPYILKSTVPPPQEGHASDQAVTSPQGDVPTPFVFSLSHQTPNATTNNGGSVKLQDAGNFPIQKEMATGLFVLEPSALRELHWAREDEWIYIVQGTGRATAFQGGASARTFDFQAGDTAVFPVGFGSYMKNTHPTDKLIYITAFKVSTDLYTDFSATQWLALTPFQVTADLLNISTDTVASFEKKKQWIIPANSN